MVCPRCGTVNPEGSKFCHQCGAALTGAPPAALPPVTPPAPGQAPGPPPVAAHHLVVHKRTSPTLMVLIAGAALAVIVLLAGVAAGAYHALKGRPAAPNGPAGVQPRAPVSHPTFPPTGPGQPPATPQAPTPPAVPAQPPTTPQAPTPPAGPAQPATPQGPTPPSGPAQPPSAPQIPVQPQQPAGPQAPSQPPSPMPPQPSAQAEMQAYQDPGGVFSIEYPKAWKVRRGDNGYTVFYQNDPEEGTLFGIFPRLVLDGEATAAQILEALQQDIRKRYPDFEVWGQKIEPDPEGNGELAFVKAGWTNGRNERMMTFLIFHVGGSGEGRSVLLLFNLQATEVAFSAVEPTFHHMFTSFR